MWPAGQEAGEEQSLDYVVWKRFLEEFVGPSMARSKSTDLQVQLWKDWGWSAGAYIQLANQGSGSKATCVRRDKLCEAVATWKYR